jgi:hypothetical protein
MNQRVDHGLDGGFPRAGRTEVTVAEEMSEALVVTADDSELAIDILDGCYSNITQLQNFKLTAFGPKARKNVLLIMSVPAKGYVNKIIIDEPDLALRQDNFSSYTLTGAVDGAPRCSGTGLGIILLIRISRDMDEPFGVFLPSVTQCEIYGTHAQVCTTREVLDRFGKLLTRDVLCLNGAMRLPYEIVFQQVHAYPSQMVFDQAQSELASETVGELDDGQLRVLIVALSEAFGVSQDVRPDLMPSTLTSEVKREQASVLRILVALSLSDAQLRAAHHFAPIVCAARAWDDPRPVIDKAMQLLREMGASPEAACRSGEG